MRQSRPDPFSIAKLPVKLGVGALCLLVAAFACTNLSGRLGISLPPLPLAALILAAAALMFLLLYLVLGSIPDVPLRRAVVALLLAAMAIYAVARRLTPAADIYQSKSVLWLVLWLLLGYVLYRALPLAADRRVHRAAAAIGTLFALFSVIGSALSAELSLDQCFFSAAASTQTLMQIAGTALLYTALLQSLFTYCLAHRSPESLGRGADFARKKRAILLVAAVIFLCWLPYYIVFFPGCMSPDSLSEVNAMLGVTELSNHHPLIHQLTVKPFLRLGELMGSLNLGVALYSLFQMLAMACVLSLSLWYMAKLNINAYLRLLVLLYYALLSTNAFYSITLWKDVLFGAFTLLMMLLLFEEARLSKEDWAALSKRSRLWRTVALIAVGFCFCTYRNNGYHAFILFLPFFCLINRLRWKRFAAAGLAVILFVVSYQHLIFNVLDVKKSAAGELLSVPLQQIARTVRDHEDIPAEERAILSEIFPDLDRLKEDYNPTLSDPVKLPSVFRSERFDAAPMRYARAWLRLGLRYPATYVTAFLCQNFGYWYPDENRWRSADYIEDNDLGLRQSERLSLFQRMLRHVDYDLAATPVISMLYSIGFMVWLLILSAGLMILKRRGRLASPLLLLLGLWLTTLASPVYCEYRYVFGLIISTPLCVLIAVSAEPQGVAIKKEPD